MTSEETKQELERIRRLNNPQKEADFKMSVQTIVYVFASIGIVLIALYASKYLTYEHDLAAAKASVDFKTVTGIIKSSYSRERSPASYRNRATYEPKVDYEYNVEGKTYHNDQIMFPNPVFRYEGESKEYAARYTAQSPVQVSYDETNPQRSLPGERYNVHVERRLAFQTALNFLR